jgi:prevent-host-death family protein
MKQIKQDYLKPNVWQLQAAKAHFSEVVKRAKANGPQHVTVYGKDEVVILSAEDFRRLTAEITGQTLIEALQASPYRDVDIEPPRTTMPVREV